MYSAHVKYGVWNGPQIPIFYFTSNGLENSLQKWVEYLDQTVDNHQAWHYDQFVATSECQKPLLSRPEIRRRRNPREDQWKTRNTRTPCKRFWRNKPNFIKKLLAVFHFCIWDSILQYADYNFPSWHVGRVLPVWFYQTSDDAWSYPLNQSELNIERSISHKLSRSMQPLQQLQLVYITH
jgi:hypothetical protein